MGEIINAYKILVGKHKGRRPLGRPRRKREESIRLDLEKSGEKVWIGLM
jgi:hypothetical protein